MVNPFRDYEFELYDYESGRHISFGCTSTRELGEPYKIGEEFVASDSAIFRNNSKRVRKCIIKKVERIGGTNKYNIYVKPTKEDVKFKDITPLLEDRDDDDGSDWWKGN